YNAFANQTTVSVGTDATPGADLVFDLNGRYTAAEFGTANTTDGVLQYNGPVNTAPQFTPDDLPGFVTQAMAGFNHLFVSRAGFIWSAGGVNGVTDNYTFNTGDFGAARFTANGFPDGGFGNDGRTIVSVGSQRDV